MLPVYHGTDVPGTTVPSYHGTLITVSRGPAVPIYRDICISYYRSTVLVQWCWLSSGSCNTVVGVVVMVVMMVNRDVIPV